MKENGLINLKFTIKFNLPFPWKRNIVLYSTIKKIRVMFTVRLFLILLILFYEISMIITQKKTFFFCDFPFECGISRNFSNRKSYCMPFFLVTLLFLIFDIEIILFFPIVYMNLSFDLLIIFLVLLFVLILGLIIEWKYGSFNWFK